MRKGKHDDSCCDPFGNSSGLILDGMDFIGKTNDAFFKKRVKE